MVEWKKLGEVITVHTGSQLNRNDMLEQGIYPVINGGRTPSGYTNEPNENGNSITISQGGESAGYVNWIDCDFWAGAHCYVVECLDDTIKRYVYHYLKNSEHELMASKQGAGIPGLNRKNLYKLDIPVPAIAEQTRIVSILDTFTAAIENLKQQIAQRRKQYEHYRDQLLDLEGKEGVEMKTLGEVCNIKNGYTPSTKNPVFWENGDIPWFTLEDIRKNGRILDDASKHITALGVKKSGLFAKDSIIVSTTATIGEYALIRTDFLCNQQISCLSIKDKNIIKPKYLYYLANGIGNWCKKNVNGGGSLLIVSTSKLQFMIVPVPSLVEQQRIVSALDTFEASIANLEQQLAQRERQYEYYRNKLLTFE